jgi:hypothetical protein
LGTLFDVTEEFSSKMFCPLMLTSTHSRIGI